MYNREYYLKHKEEYIERNREWRKNNKERFYELVKKSRTKKAKELRLKGESYVWHSEPSRKKLYEKRDRRINQDNRDGEVQNNSNETR